MSLAPGTLLGPYEIVGPLGAGGMGEVYKARDTRLERTVAVKVSKEAFEERFRNEALAVAALNHPHIAKLFDVGPDYLVMEYVEGKPLRGPLPVTEALKLAGQIADALEHAHKNGVVHRDLKPSNILVTKGGVKVLDFGLAQRRTPVGTTGGGAPTLTAEGALVGTPRYMAPEQIEGKPADERTDIFAFGLLLYEMLTGEHAFEGKSAAGVMAAILEKEPMPIASLKPATPQAVVKVVETCLAKDPADRWQSLRELKHALEWSAQAAPPPRGRIRSAWTVAAVAALVALTLGVALIARKADPPRPRSVRLRLDMPPNVQGSITPSAVSPDGRHIAFAGKTAGSQAIRLYVRRLEALAPTELPGSERGASPFWSPDSRQIAFGKLGAGGLWKMNLEDGAPQIICSECLKAGGAITGAGGTWSPADVIVFSDAGKLHRVSAQGGEPQPLGALAPGETGRFWPQFLPDGRHYIYLSLSSRKEDQGIYVGALDSEARQRVAASAHTPRFSPPGYLLYVDDGRLVARTFDAERLEVSGEAVPVLDEAVRTFANPAMGGLALFSASSNGVLAWLPRLPDLGQLTWMDRSGRKLETIGEPGDYTAPVLSPDERSLAVCVKDSDTRDIWTSSATTGARRRLTFDSHDDCTPAWSPDGQWIAFTSDRRAGIREIYRKRADGSGDDELLLASPDFSLHVESWSADGRFLSYNAVRPGRSQDVFVLPLDKENASPVPFLATPAFESASKLSPNGRYLAYMSTESGQIEVYVREVTLEGRPGPGKWQISQSFGWGPRWRSDGRELYFHDYSRRMMAVAVETDGPTFKAGSPQPLGITEVPNNSGWFGVTRDGQRFLFNLPAQAPEPIRVLVNWFPAAR